MTDTPTKVVVSVAEMARMVGLSRARFYQLMGTTFPWPLYDTTTRRPIYVEELQKVCLEVRRRNCGIDGRPVLFYARRTPLTTAAKPRRAARLRQAEAPAEVVAGVRSLGLTSATAAEVAAAAAKLFPGGVGSADPGEVIRAVFLHLKRRDGADKVG